MQAHARSIYGNCQRAVRRDVLLIPSKFKGPLFKIFSGKSKVGLRIKWSPKVTKDDYSDGRNL